MTLTEWESQFGRTATRPATRLRPDAACIECICIGDAGCRELWHLSDWVVTAVSGGTVWLSRRDECGPGTTGLAESDAPRATLHRSMPIHPLY